MLLGTWSMNAVTANYGSFNPGYPRVLFYALCLNLYKANLL